MNHSFEHINQGYNSTFQSGELSLGVVVPIENYPSGPVPSMQDHLTRVKLVEELGFKAIWIRDIPLNIPSFGDAGQTFEPFSYLSFLAGQTSTIALGISSIALPLHHPIHVAKAAATVDQLSEGRLIMGVASGDRPEEYPSLGLDFERRGQAFREAFSIIRASANSFPITKASVFGQLDGRSDVLPKPFGKKIPMLVTGSSRQTLEWNATNGDGWMNYPRNLYMQNDSIKEYRELVKQSGDFDKPFMQPLYVVLQENDDFRPEPIPLGFRIGINPLIEYLNELKELGVNHVALNLRFNDLNIPKTLEKIASKALLHFHLEKTTI